MMRYCKISLRLFKQSYYLIKGYKYKLLTGEYSNQLRCTDFFLINIDIL